MDITDAFQTFMLGFICVAVVDIWIEVRKK